MASVRGRRRADARRRAATAARCRGQAVASAPMAAKTVVQLTVPGPEGDREVRLSSPDKVYFPERGITKRQVVEYYLAVSEPMTRVLLDRPTNLKRFPDGVEG